MPLTLRHYRRSILFYSAGLVLFLFAVLTATAWENASATVGNYLFGALLCMALFLPLIAYNVYKYISLRRDFSEAEPLLGTVMDWKRGAARGTARLIIACEDRIYRTPALFGHFAARRWVEHEVAFAIGEDGYVFVFRVN